MKEFETNLVGRLVELVYPNDDPTRARGRVSAAYPVTSPECYGLVLWLEVEDNECAARFWPDRPAVGDVVIVSTNVGGGEATIRIIKEPPSDDALLNASAALRAALEDVVRARRLVDEALHQRPGRPDAA